jgi:hypothetical protein
MFPGFTGANPCHSRPVSLGIVSPALIALTAAFALLGLGSLVGSARSFRRRRPFSFSVRSLSALLFAALCALCMVVVMATQGYRALTREDVAVEVHVQPTGKQTFRARFVFPDGHQATHELAGDQLYVDAHILKWKPVANLLGLHTAYELDRVAGRYASLDDERTRSRTVGSLARAKRLDLFDLRQKYAPLGFLVDTEYGSATFVDVRSPGVVEIRVSTTGLLVRPKRAAP